ncbi:hypothetical protein T552_03326 [Pneumocystis carinii B80]|uniref:Exonuclease domain-containing protein n=1 Tax=Pneumocystis carinii (strain B80) TaxID=1408658 RepID=A0A0W4ZBC6_PNEC8|nr:hypothetical protein T552_03326 [Pneumocystis carinii B80]KTW25714.1 hypothetical protein T552_03326 [Pneumocystis carinii B80]
MFSNNIFLPNIICPHIRKKNKCDILLCPFGHSYHETHYRNSKKQKQTHESSTSSTSVISADNYINTNATNSYDNNFYNKTFHYKKSYINDNFTNTIQLNNLEKNDLKNNLSQNTSELDNVGPKFISTLIHIPHETRVHFFKLIKQEFLRIYSDVNENEFLAQNASLKKELEILNSTYQNKTIYINSCKNFIISLKKTYIKKSNEISDNVLPNLEHMNISLSDLEKYILNNDQLQTAGYILEIPVPKTQSTDIFLHCDRCNMPFSIDKNNTYTKCNYHWGKLIKTSYEQNKIYSCCYDNNTYSKGCITSPHHVFKITSPSKLSAQIQFVESQAPMQQSSFLTAAVLDCEMIYTTGGMELARVTIYDINENLLLDKLIKPKNKVLDFNTRWSGIKSLNDAKISLSDLHNIIFIELKLCNLTILIGHGLENDLIAIRLIHKRIIDTALLFQHKKGLQHKYSLKYLAKKYLKREIQTNVVDGHDSKEDAKATLDLLRYKIYHDKLKK